jgi:hypothetical protein
LYPNCEDGQKKLGSTLELLRWKAENNVTDSRFNKLLIMMKKLLPRDNELAGGGVQVDQKYGMTTVDRDEPFVRANDVA